MRSQRRNWAFVQPAGIVTAWLSVARVPPSPTPFMSAFQLPLCAGCTAVRSSTTPAEAVQGAAVPVSKPPLPIASAAAQPPPPPGVPSTIGASLFDSITRRQANSLLSLKT